MDYIRSYKLITLYPFLACLVSLIPRQGLQRVRGEIVVVVVFNYQVYKEVSFLVGWDMHYFLGHAESVVTLKPKRYIGHFKWTEH